MTATNKSKWYNSKLLLIILFFILPPLGIVGILKRNSATWKKIVYTLSGIISSLFLLFLTVGITGMIFFPTDYYKDGNEYFYKGQYDKAVDNYNKVPKDNIHYTDAQNQLSRIKQISDSLTIQKQIEIESIDLEKQKQHESLIVFQKHWADSIMKVYEGYIIKNTVLLDTIYFQLGMEATKGNWRHSADLNQSVIQKDYDNIVSVKFANMDKPNTIMLLIPDEKQSAENQKIAARKERILKQFSSGDGSHRNLEKWIKNNMNDPKSFEHVETTYTDKGDHLLVYMKYRGKNAFGAKVIQTVIGTVDLNGNVLSVKH